MLDQGSDSRSQWDSDQRNWSSLRCYSAGFLHEADLEGLANPLVGSTPDLILGFLATMLFSDGSGAMQAKCEA